MIKIDNITELFYDSNKSLLLIGKLIAAIILICFSLVLLAEYINYSDFNMISYDDGYNATVAANYAKYGEYRVSYPSEITFYNMITTGETVLLPTALMYRVFGISNFTTCIVPIIYSLLAIWAIYVLLIQCIEHTNSILNIAVVAAVICLILSDRIYHHISTHLIGEAAALFFVIVAFILLQRYLKTQKERALGFAGAAMAMAFLTKSSMIFIVVSFFGMLLLETIMKTISKKGFRNFLIGFFAGFMILESFKIAQLGSKSNWITWWKDEWSNMMDQSGESIEKTVSFLKKFNYLESIFGRVNRYICVILLLLPIITYIIILFCRMTHRVFGDSGLLTMSMAGICGDSLIIYFLLLGGNGLMYSRRHEVNALLVRLFAIYIVICVCKYFIGSYVREKTYPKVICLISIIALLFAVPLIVSVNSIETNIKIYSDKENEDTYSAQLMKEFLAEINQLPADATLYTAGWWQEPNITLFLERDMHDIYELPDPEAETFDNSYFIVGSLIHNIYLEDLEMSTNADFVRVDTSEVDYSRYQHPFDRKDIETFAIYKIEKR